MKQSGPYLSSMTLRKFVGILRRPFSSTFAGACPIKTSISTVGRSRPIPVTFQYPCVWTLFLPLFSTTVHKIPPPEEKKGRASGPASKLRESFSGATVGRRPARPFRKRSKCGKFLEVLCERHHPAAGLLPVVVLVRGVVAVL